MRWRHTCPAPARRAPAFPCPRVLVLVSRFENRFAGECPTMNADELRSLQAPLKEQYKVTPEAARITLRAQGRVGEGVSCRIETGKGLVTAGLHPATGGSGTGGLLGRHAAGSAGGLRRRHAECSGDRAGIPLRDATVQAEVISISAARSESRRKYRSDFRASGSLHAGHRRIGRSAGYAAAADRALLRGLPDTGSSTRAFGRTQMSSSHRPTGMSAESSVVFIAGASGAIGRVLCRLLVRDGWQVVGTTRSASRADMLQSLGVVPVIVDVFDAAALSAAGRRPRDPPSSFIS